MEETSGVPREVHNAQELKNRLEESLKTGNGAVAFTDRNFGDFTQLMERSLRLQTAILNDIFRNIHSAATTDEETERAYLAGLKAELQLQMQERSRAPDPLLDKVSVARAAEIAARAQGRPEEVVVAEQYWALKIFDGALLMKGQGAEIG